MVEVPFISEKEIESAAEQVLLGYERAMTPIAVPPVPIEKIITFLNLKQDILDLYAFLGMERDAGFDLLGALCVESGRIYVHHEIDPDVYSWREGRYHFTLAHEIGHWVLHRRLLEARIGQLSLLEDELRPALVCRKSDSVKPIEWQANKFASCLLMPSKLIHYAWHGAAKSGSSNSATTQERLVKQIANEFACSVQAMRIRLESLGLLASHRNADFGL
jgi:IrrE N-terminal-like domain